MRRPETFTALNGFRFLAAIAVVFFHFAPKVAEYDTVPAVLSKLVNEGPAAVGFLFILSGFVPALRYLQDITRIETPGAFYWARFARLYPAYLVGFLLFAPIAVQKYLLQSNSANVSPSAWGTAVKKGDVLMLNATGKNAFRI